MVPLPPSSLICPPSQASRKHMSIKTLSNVLLEGLLHWSPSHPGKSHQACLFPQVGLGNGLSISLPPPNKGVQCCVLRVISGSTIALFRDDRLGWAEAQGGVSLANNKVWGSWLCWRTMLWVGAECIRGILYDIYHLDLREGFWLE